MEAAVSPNGIKNWEPDAKNWEIFIAFWEKTIAVLPAGKTAKAEIPNTQTPLSSFFRTFAFRIPTIVLMSPNALHRHLSRRISQLEVKQLCARLDAPDAAPLQQAIGWALRSDDTRTAINATWICSHLRGESLSWLDAQLDALATSAAECVHPTLLRLRLAVVYHLLERQYPARRRNNQIPPEPSGALMKLYDSCWQHVASAERQLASASTSLKIVAVLCRALPELHHETQLLLDMLDADMLSPSLAAVRRRVARQLATRRPLALHHREQRHDT